MPRHPSKKISSFGSRFSTIVSVSLVLLIIGLIMIASSVTSGANDSLRRKVSMVMRLVPDATPQQTDSVKSLLTGSAFASSVRYTSAEEVYQEEMAYNSELLDALGENPYAPEFDIFLVPEYVCSDSINALMAQLSALPCVDTVYSSTETVDTIDYVLRKATFYLSILGLVMLVISVVLIFNTVNLVVYSRRFIIHTMKLVGAKAAFIRRPFVSSGIGIGVIAGLVASAVICALHIYASSSDLAFLFFQSWLHTAVLCVILVVIGAAFCGFAAFVASNRFIRYSYDNLYVK